jgi:nicotinamide-nucleotide amidase
MTGAQDWEEIAQLAERTLQQCRALGLTLATAESCTGGLIAAALTDIPGSSDVLERGFVTYSNRAKRELLGVPEAMIESDGAVSERVARAMAEGARERARVDIAVSATGIAGPGGGTRTKPVGLVHLACDRKGFGGQHLRLELGPLSRREIRLAATAAGLELILSLTALPEIA